MSEILTREEVESLIDREGACEPWEYRLLAHDAALRDQLAEKEKEIERLLAAATSIAEQRHSAEERAAKAERERDEDRRREYGYSQETVNALTKNRDAAEARVRTLEGLLREARGIVAGYAQHFPKSDAPEAIARIDAALAPPADEKERGEG